MASLFQFLHFITIIPWLLICTSVTSIQTPKHYVVYMGSSVSNINGGDDQITETDHLQLLSSIIPREENERISLTHHYNHAFRGFSAMFTDKEASVLSVHDGVVSVFPDLLLQLHTTRSWDFLETQLGMQARGIHKALHSSSDVIIGVIDTGIWPESPSFKDDGIGKIPKRWKGACMEVHDFKKSNCNRHQPVTKLVKLNPVALQGILLAMELIPPQQQPVPESRTSYYGLAGGTARGGSTSTRIASYKACSEEGCSDYLTDPIAIGAFHAEQMGVMVVCSGGNSGPDPYTIVNSAPWKFTVAASNIDRAFQSTVTLGNGKIFQGSAINFSNLTNSKMYSLVSAKDVAAKFTPTSQASNCYPGSLDHKKASGKIVVCVDNDPTVLRRIKKLVVENAKAKGMILISEEEKGVPYDAGVFPFTEVANTEGYQILQYINSTKTPTATILPTVEIPRHKPAPVVAYFSSRGPAALTENILKPDIMAPGVAILAAMMPSTEPGSVPMGKKPSEFAIKSSTSMACPHVTGAAAFIRSVHKEWSSSMIKSALMTTAITYNNMWKPLTNSSNTFANSHDIGVGEIIPLRALNPGLVFETTMEEYLYFLCYYGHSGKNTRSMSSTNFNCPRNSIEDLISNINYPSVSIAKLDRHKRPKVIKRTVTNVGFPNATYTAKVHAPEGLVVKVFPKRLVFTETVKKVSYKIAFYGKKAHSGYNFGSLTWFDDRQSVHSVFAVNVK
ncbi:Subtilisin-like protease [Quillaja saponaria]|uniref:Subtilisin-like protease n=1 Tax=Quillaja saponaria TaxID=32244 RepID=A0AAD7L0Y0_QUISA|nr:Subtilisin-like protease [Quillaja saponaria]